MQNLVLNYANENTYYRSSPYCPLFNSQQEKYVLKEPVKSVEISYIMFVEVT